MEESRVFNSKGRAEVFLLFRNMIFCDTDIDLGSTFRLSKLVKVYEQKVCLLVSSTACRMLAALSLVVWVRATAANRTGDAEKLKTNGTAHRSNLFVKP